VHDGRQLNRRLKQASDRSKIPMKHARFVADDGRCTMDDDCMPNSVPSASFSLRSLRLKKEPDNIMLSIFYKLQFFTIE